MARTRTKVQLKPMKNSKFLYVGYYDESGRRRWKSTGETTEAMALRRVALWMDSEGSVSPTLTESNIKTSLTFKELTRDFFSGKDCPFLQRRNLLNNTREETSAVTDLSNLQNWLLPDLGSVEFKDINKKRIESYILWLTTTPSRLTKRTLSPTAIHNTLGCLRKILKTLYEIERVPTDKSGLVPSYGRKTQNRRTPLEFIEIKQILLPVEHQIQKKPEISLALHTHWEKNQKVHAMLLLCYFSGLRISEVQAIKPPRFKSLEVDNETHYFANICVTWAEDLGRMKADTKTHDSRWVPIPKPIWTYIIPLIFSLSEKKPVAEMNPALELNTDKLLFASSQGTPISRSVVRKQLLTALKIAGVNKVTSPHQGRNFFQSYLTGRVDSKVIDIMIGHSLGGSQETYTTIERILEVEVPALRVLNDFLTSQKTLTIKSL